MDNDLGSKNVAEINAWGKNLTTLVIEKLLVHNQHGIFLDSWFVFVSNADSWGLDLIAFNKFEPC